MSASDEQSQRYSTFEAEPEARLRKGQVVAEGRYRVGDELGQGGMAIVYEAEDLRSGQRIALKVVTGKFADKADTAERYRNEARLASALAHHPHVVHPLDVGRLSDFHDRLYLAADLVRGRSLGAIVLENPRGMEVERVCRIGRDLASALRALHERGIVHRDVKPGNVMLDRSTNVEVAKLLDFGCAHATGDGEVEASADLTQAHERVGSPVYMAPEQAIGMRPDPAFDLYALGATLYELLTGSPPYAGSSKAEIVQRKCALDDPPRPVQRVRDGVPPRLAAVVDACLAREADDRPPTAAAVEAELDAILDELDGPAPSTTARRDAAGPVASTTARRDAAGPVASTTARRDAAVPVERRPAAAVPSAVIETVAEPTSGRPVPWRWVAVGALLLGGVGVFAAIGGTTDRGPEDPSADVPASAGAAEGNADSAPAPVAAPPDVAADDEGSTAASTTSDGAPAAASGSTTVGDPRNDDEPDATTADPDAETAPGPAPRPRTPPKWATPECQAVREGAVLDRASRKWAAVLDAVTSHRKCWSDRDERMLLHVGALVGLERYQECARLGGGSKNRQLQRMAKQCQHKIGEVNR